MSRHVTGTMSAVICAAWAFGVFESIELVALVFGPGSEPMGKFRVIPLLLVYPSLVAACVVLGHIAGLFLCRLVDKVIGVRYALRLPIWVAVLSITVGVVISSTLQTAAFGGAVRFFLPLLVCGCLVTMILRLAASRWMILNPVHTG